jgi:hypothetical protein
MQKLTADFLNPYDLECIELERLELDRATSGLTLQLLCPVWNFRLIRRCNQMKRLLHLGQPATSLVRLAVSFQGVEIRQDALLDAISTGVLRLPLAIDEISIADGSGEQRISLDAEERQLIAAFRSGSIEEIERLIDTSRVWTY